MTGKVDMKVVMLGQVSCGKTSVVERFMYNRFNTNYQTTIGAAFGARHLTIGGKQICVGLWDTAGSERYEAMSRIYYRDAKAAIICYDITCAETVNRAKFWVNEVQRNEENCRIFLCGSKLDLITKDDQARQVDFHDMSNYADEVGAKLYETSSKTGENIEIMFTHIVEDFAENNSEFMANLKMIQLLFMEKTTIANVVEPLRKAAVICI